MATSKQSDIRGNDGHGQSHMSGGGLVSDVATLRAMLTDLRDQVARLEQLNEQLQADNAMGSLSRRADGVVAGETLQQWRDRVDRLTAQIRTSVDRMREDAQRFKIAAGGSDVVSVLTVDAWVAELEGAISGQ